ncbi:hypothetical protein INT44_004431 [Umbelopsis vinacea]|uniref:Methyltransferase type 11 domain-containing protein n=1 Tax=Umbelopsis vinacea TaxID=44442 RepID=A0A8H7QCA5_9FUNG|nr:hypothetical protein INT44_004431 [Umbelopsis vinacea]
MTSKNPHSVAEQGFSTGADDYAKARPSYPAAALQCLQAELKLIPAETKILDLAAGTGKFTELLVKDGYQVTAVEPVAEMRAKITEKLPTVKAVEGTSWNIPVENDSQHVVVIAQAFHWFDDIETLRECRRVLKSNGYIVFIWNMESQERCQWIAKLRQIYEQHDVKAPQYRKGAWKKVFNTEEAGELFHLPLNHHQFTNDFLIAGKEVVWQRIKSKSYIAVMPPQEQEKLQQQVYAILDDPENGFIPNSDGEFLFLHETDIYWAQRK